MAEKSKKAEPIIEKEHKEVGEKTAGVASLMIFGRFISLLLLGIAFVVVARILGPSVYGIYTLAISYAGFFGLGFGDLGVSTTFSKFIGQYSIKKDKDEIEKVISNGYMIVLISGIAFTVLAFLLSGFIAVHVFGSASLTYVGQVVSFFIISAMLFSISYYAMVGFGNGAYVALVIILQAISQSILSIILAVMGFGAIAPILGVILGYVVAVITALLILHFKLGIRFRKPSLGQMKKLLAFSSPISVYNGLRAFITNLSPIILGIFATTVIVGNFGVALRTSTIISNVTEALGIAVLPMFAYTVYTKSISSNIGKFFNYAAYLTYLIITPVLLYLAILAKEFSYTVFSAEYLFAPSYIVVISLGTFLWVIATYTNMLLVGANKVRELLKYSLLIACIELILLFTLVPPFGGIGLTAILFIITPTLISFFLLGVAKRQLNVHLEIKRLGKVVLSGLISAAFLLPLLVLTNNYIIILVAGAVEQIILYPIIIVLTRSAEREDLHRLKRVTKKIPVANRVVELFVSYSEHFIRS